MTRVIYLREQELDAPGISDELLLKACTRGDTAALGMLFRRHGKTVFRFLSRMSPRDRSCHDDLVQNVFMAVNDGAGRFKGESSVSTWILAIAANLLKNHIRGESRRRKAMASVAVLPPAAVDTPQALAERRILLERLIEAVDGLSFKLRVVFVMCDLEGVGGQEAARTLGIKEGTVWRRLHDARRILGAAIDEKQRRSP
jgi:RNA polymerase sigma-70 factor, ECF subfamily